MEDRDANEFAIVLAGYFRLIAGKCNLADSDVGRDAIFIELEFCYEIDVNLVIQKVPWKAIPLPRLRLVGTG
jgi:hypothetical protein